VTAKFQYGVKLKLQNVAYYYHYYYSGVKVRGNAGALCSPPHIFSLPEFKCVTFRKLILRKIIKIVTTAITTIIKTATVS